MKAELEALRDAPPPPVDRVRRRVARRRTRRRWVAAGAVAAVLLGVGLLLPPGSRDRGVASVPLVALDAVAEGPGGVRPLVDGAEVAPGERVVFFVRTSVAGEARILEEGAPVYPPPTGSWRIDAGESVPGGTSPLSWRPDERSGALRYVAEVCVDDGPSTCGRADLVLRWAR